jgi:putative SOS response-associated peptidase YedK
VCARYSLKANPLELKDEFELAEPPVLAPRYNVAPTQAAPIITAPRPRALTIARWGLIPSWAKAPERIGHTFNARAETIATKGIFKDSFAHRRCLIPVDGFYEWRQLGKLRQPIHISLGSHRPFSLAGIWAAWTSHEGLERVTFSVVTTAANDFMRGIHDRMPVVIARGDRHRWLTDDAHAGALLRPWCGEPLRALEVSQAVNKVANDDPRCLEPAKTMQLTLL